MPTILRDRIIFNEKDWIAGLNPQYTSTASNIQKMGNGLASVRSFDPYRFFGYASPGFNPTDLTNVSVIDAVQKNIVVNGAYAYSVGGTKVHQITIATAEITTPTTFPHAVASSTMEDVAVYKIGTTAYLFYSWYDGTDGDIGRYDFATTFDDDFMSTVPANAAVMAKSKPMPMIVGADDVLYFSDGNNVHAFDGQTGASGTLSKNVLTLPVDYVITGFARYRNSLVVFAYTASASSSYYLGRATAFFWDYLSLDPYDKIELDDNYVSAPFEYKGTIGCFTSGRQPDKGVVKNNKLKIFNGETFEPKANFIGSVPVVGGVDIIENMIYWNSGGKIFSFGTPFIGVDNEFNQVTEGTGTTSGFIKTIATGLQIASTGTTTSGGMQSLNSNYYDVSFVATVLAKPNWPIGKQGKIKSIITRFGTINSAGRTLTASLVDRLGTSSEFLSAVSAITSSTYINKNEDIQRKFDDLKLVLQWAAGSGATAAPIIDNVEVEFETINL